MPVVVGIFSSVIPWDSMPRIQAMNLPFVISVCIGLTVFGLYSYFWKFLPKYLSLSAVLFGALGAGVLIFYIATPAAQSPAAYGKLLIRVMVTIILTCVLLAVYMEYWKKAAQSVTSAAINDNKGSALEDAAAEDRGLLESIADKDLSLIYLPPGHVEVGLWVFFGLVVVADALGGAVF